MDTEENLKEYRWETGYERTWEAITEDQSGGIEVSVQEMLQRARRKKLLEKGSGSKTKLGMMRHVYIILDMSETMKLQDMKPSRLLCVLNLLEKFAEEFFHLNPISQIGIITTKNKRAEIVSDLAGNPKAHVEQIRKLAGNSNSRTGNSASNAQVANSACSGEPSLQNSLELAMQTLKHMPAHATREIVALMGSLTTCDPGDIHNTIQVCKNANVRCSVISLAAEVHVYKKLAKETDGVFSVILDDVHLRDLLQEHVEPPPSTVGNEPALIKMGFPSHASSESASLGLCMCHLDTTSSCKLTTSGFLCPQCQSKYCELPVECKACGLTLVSAPHLARSYHHLFPLPAFNELPAAELSSQHCFSCARTFEATRDINLYQCPDCRNIFCCDCDIFIHEALHSCPGCSSTPQLAAVNQTPQPTQATAMIPGVGTPANLNNTNGNHHFNGIL